jgi:hypothetical protein
MRIWASWRAFNQTWQSLFTPARLIGTENWDRVTRPPSIHGASRLPSAKAVRHDVHLLSMFDEGGRTDEGSISGARQPFRRAIALGMKYDYGHDATVGQLGVSLPNFEQHGPLETSYYERGTAATGMLNVLNVAAWKRSDGAASEHRLCLAPSCAATKRLLRQFSRWTWTGCTFLICSIARRPPCSKWAQHRTSGAQSPICTANLQLRSNLVLNHPSIHPPIHRPR